MLAILTSFASCVYYLQHEEKSFLLWMRSTNQIYTGDEYHFRLGIFLSNSRLVKEHNKQNKKYTLSLNKFSAYTPSEYKSLLNIRVKPQKRQTIKSVSTPTTDSVDWRDKNVVNPIEDMSSCGASWAFSAVQALESNYAIYSNNLQKFSEQEQIDCVTSCQGCSGGDAEVTFQNVIDNGGYVCLKKDYSYTGSQGTCKFDQYDHFGPVISSIVDIQMDDENDLAEKIEQMGPAAAIIDASHFSFQLYTQGIYDEPSCSADVLNLAVGVVGFGVENGIKYWIVKNAWGTYWGERGYIRMIWLNNQCGIASWASIPRP